MTVVNSIERDDIPVEEGFVRGMLKSSGFVIKPLDNDPVTGKPRCEITYLVQLNPMGWIPTMYAPFNTHTHTHTQVERDC